MQQDNESGVSEPSRRRLLKGMGALGGALVLAGGCPIAHVQRPQNVPGMLSPGACSETQPFYGQHQAGILTPQQTSMMLVTFDVLASDKADPECLFQLLTNQPAFPTTGGPVPDTPNLRLPSMDSGTLGARIALDNLTMTLPVGSSLLGERYGLKSQMPKRLRKMIRSPNDSLDAVLCHDDVLLQICANIRDTAIHTLHGITKRTLDLLSVRWKRKGFTSDHAVHGRGRETPINLSGFKDGTANPDAADTKLMQSVVWVTDGQDEPAWAQGGNYQVVRPIQFRIGFWDRTSPKEQQTIFGHDKHTGAPLGMQHKHDVPDYANDPEGEMIAFDNHIRLANPHTKKTDSSLMMYRGYSYSFGVTNSDQLDTGLSFVYCQRDLKKGFLTMQKCLNGKALEEYVRPTGGGYFFTLPGVKIADSYLGRSLLET